MTPAELTIHTEDIPEYQREQLAAAVLDGVYAFYESAENRKAFEVWMEKRKAKATAEQGGMLCAQT